VTAEDVLTSAADGAEQIASGVSITLMCRIPMQSALRPSAALAQNVLQQSPKIVPLDAAKINFRKLG